VLAFFMLSSFLIAVPTGVKIFNWVATLWRGTVEWRVPLLFCVGGIATFLMGGITGIFLAVFPVDWQLHDTYFVVAHFHYTAFGASAFAMVGALYYWFPKMTGRMLSERLGQLHFLLAFVGFNLTFYAQHQLGIWGMPRRTFHYPQSPEWGTLNLVSTIGSYVLAVSVIMFLVNVVMSARSGRPAGDDPWEADTLEWATTSPPAVYNFAKIPVVHSARPLKEEAVAPHG
jgi:heme/copper-type cytochrome/quinol oxidase subunit 1